MANCGLAWELQTPEGFIAWLGGLKTFMDFISRNFQILLVRSQEKSFLVSERRRGKVTILNYTKIILHKEGVFSRLSYLGYLSHPAISSLLASHKVKKKVGRLRNTCEGHIGKDYRPTTGVSDPCVMDRYWSVVC